MRLLRNQSGTHTLIKDLPNGLSLTVPLIIDTSWLVYFCWSCLNQECSVKGVYKSALVKYVSYDTLSNPNRINDAIEREQFGKLSVLKFK